MPQLSFAEEKLGPLVLETKPKLNVGQFVANCQSIGGTASDAGQTGNGGRAVNCQKDNGLDVTCDFNPISRRRARATAHARIKHLLREEKWPALRGTGRCLLYATMRNYSAAFSCLRATALGARIAFTLATASKMAGKVGRLIYRPAPRSTFSSPFS